MSERSERLAALHAAAFVTDRPWSAQEFADLLAALGALCAEQPGGFALARLTLDEAELLTLAVDPAMQRRGVARTLMGDWHDLAIAAGAARAFLEVAADNHAAMALYSACGYQRIGQRRGYYTRQGGARADAVVMSRPLTRQ